MTITWEEIQERPRKQEVVGQLFRFAAKHQNVQLSVYCGRAWARLACNIQSSVSQCFLNRAGSLAAVEKDIDLLNTFFLSGFYPFPFFSTRLCLLGHCCSCVASPCHVLASLSFSLFPEKGE